MLVYGEQQVAGSDEYEFEFRGADKAHWAHTMILTGMLR
jgi:hypothetical protein